MASDVVIAAACNGAQGQGESRQWLEYFGKLLTIPVLICVFAWIGTGGVARAEQHAPRRPIELVLEWTLVDYLRPGYARFNETASELEVSVARLCGDPSGRNLDSARSAFRTAAIGWARIEWLRLGPVMSSNRLERILFFPDRKGTGRKQVQSAIATYDQRVTTVSSLAGQSVAMQGLGALEYILFGSDSRTLAQSTGGHRCAFAQAVATNLVNLSGEIIDGWGPASRFVPLFLNPAAGNPVYRTETEALNLLLGQMIHGLEAIRDTRVGAFLNKQTPDHDRPNSALFWRSGVTMATIRAGLSGLEMLFVESGINVMARDIAPKLAAVIRSDFAQAIRISESLDGPVADLLADTEHRDKLVSLSHAIKVIIGRLDQDFAQAANLAVGFSFGDGD